MTELELESVLEDLDVALDPTQKSAIIGIWLRYAKENDEDPMEPFVLVPIDAVGPRPQKPPTI